MSSGATVIPRLLRFLGVTASIIVASSCASFARGNFATPIVELRDVRLKGIGIQGGTLDVILEVTNLNEYRIDASRITYRLYVDTTQIATGEVNKLVTLEAKKKVEVILPVAFGNKELMAAGQALSKTGSVDYRIAGEVTVASPFGNFTRPYDGKGHFDSAGKSLLGR
jgi:LEA14-like dessication related protein